MSFVRCGNGQHLLNYSVAHSRSLQSDESLRGHIKLRRLIRYGFQDGAFRQAGFHQLDYILVGQRLLGFDCRGNPSQQQQQEEAVAPAKAPKA